jgi:drug/metabolite transporter (DMT)-like permease
MRSEIALFFCIIVVGTVGELFISRAMKIVGEVKELTPRAVAAAAVRAARIGWMWLGFVMMALAYFALLGILARANVSFVIPVTSLSYVVGAVGGQWFLGENVTHQRWIGILLVCGGVALVFFGKG